MSLDTILDRLKICNGEITGIVYAMRLPPEKPLLLGDLPCVYAIPRGLTQSMPRLSAGLYEVTRRFTARVLVARTNIAAFDTTGEGAKILADAAVFPDRFIDYYMAHPHLSTKRTDEGGAGLPDLVGLARDVSVTDGGLQPGITGPGGESFVAIDVLLDITERRKASRIS